MRDLGRCRFVGQDRHLVGSGAHAGDQRDHHAAFVVAVDAGPGAEPVGVGVLPCAAEAPSLFDGEGDEVDAFGELAQRLGAIAAADGLHVDTEGPACLLGDPDLAWLREFRR